MAETAREKREVNGFKLGCAPLAVCVCWGGEDDVRERRRWAA
jgi:hypothetical protein